MAIDWKKALIAALVLYALYHFFFRKTSGYKLNDLDMSRTGNYGTGPAAAGYMSMADYSSEFPGGEKLGEFTPDKILAGQNFLDPRSQIGYPETIGGNLRNANRQERSEPPNPRTGVSIWNQSTIPPDVMRPVFEIGSGEY